MLPPQGARIRRILLPPYHGNSISCVGNGLDRSANLPIYREGDTRKARDGGANHIKIYGRAWKPAPTNGAPSVAPYAQTVFLCVGTVLPVPFTPPQTPFAFRYAYFPNPSIRLYRLGNIQKTAIAVLWGFVLQQFQKLRTNFSADNKFFNDKTLPHGFGEIRGVH